MTTPTTKVRDLPAGFVLRKGSHQSFVSGACLMEADAAAYASDAAAAKSPEERACIRSRARRPIIEATLRAFERVISIAEAP